MKMANEDKNHAPSSGRPFQLRPSILSGSGFGSSFSTGTVGEKPSKGFMLRPSALSSAADKLETNKTDTRKRQLSGDNEDQDSKPEEDTKKQKVSAEKEEEEPVKKPEEPTKQESTLKLTEDIEKPTGIGSFGFATGTKDDKNNKSKNGLSSTNYFAQSIKPGEKLGFVFGASSTTSTTSSNTSFNALKSDSKSDSESGGDTTTPEETPTSESGFHPVSSREQLLENASEYEKTHNNRQHYEEVDKFTGEEGEQQILQIICKLHVFDKERKTWLERGRGTLRLNDKCEAEGCFQSRLVFRTQGVNIVQLNTKLFPEMCCERVKDKSIRISAMEPETKEVKVFLITASIKDALQTYTAIDRRLSALKRSQRENESQKQESSSTKKNDSSNEEESESENSNPRQEASASS